MRQFVYEIYDAEGYLKQQGTIYADDDMSAMDKVRSIHDLPATAFIAVGLPDLSQWETK